jgi:glycosyltransferase involved in cell wall biosynthesis
MVKQITIGYMKLGKEQFISNLAVTNNFLDKLSRFVKVKIISIETGEFDFQKLKTLDLDYLLTDLNNFGIEQFLLREERQINIPYIIILHTVYHWLEGLLYIIPLIRKDDIVIAPSEYIKKSFLKITGKIKVHVIPHCQDVVKIQKNIPCGFRRSGKVIGYMGRIDESKNVEALIDCMPGIISRLGDVHLNIIGPLSGSTIKNYPKSQFVVRLERKIKKLKLARNVTFTGVQLGFNKYKILAKSDIFVYPTVYRGESFAMSNLEALACGVPVITTDWAANRELIKKGRNGYLLDVNLDDKKNILKVNKCQLASLIIKTLENEKHLSFMKRNAYESARNYDFRKVILKLISLLKRKRFVKTIGRGDWKLFRNKNIIEFKEYYRKEMLFYVCFFGLALKPYFVYYNKMQNNSDQERSYGDILKKKNNQMKNDKINQTIRRELFRYLSFH